jgi:6,7-dimethyl-8-ribityllumazine synthase
MKKILIVLAPYYEDIVTEMYKNALDVLTIHDGKLSNKVKIKYDIINVAGAFEIPVTISKNIKKYDGFIALGCIIKGETPHFDFISRAAIDGIMKISIESKKPIGNGIITCLNMKQAMARKKKGSEAAEAVMSVFSQ